MRVRNSINEDKNTMNENRCKRCQVLRMVGDLHMPLEISEILLEISKMSLGISGSPMREL